MSHQIELNEYVMSTLVCTVLGSRWRTEKQETESTKSRCWKIGLEVMLGAGKEKGGLADAYSTPIGPQLHQPITDPPSC